MSTLTPNQVQSLVTIAFTLEAISDKPGCTTRYEDLPGKPLSDFLIAGINVAPAFGKTAEDYQVHDVQTIFHRAVEALKETNRYKSPKTINMGLMEMLLVAVGARLRAVSGSGAIALIPEMLQQTTNADVQHMLDARLEAWQTSNNAWRREFDHERYRDCASVRAYYDRRIEDSGPSDACYQWAKEIAHGNAILRAFYDGMPEGGEAILAWIKHRYPQIQTQFAGTKKGILADMCAAAIFLRLSEVSSSALLTRFPKT